MENTWILSNRKSVCCFYIDITVGHLPVVGLMSWVPLPSGRLKMGDVRFVQQQWSPQKAWQQLFFRCLFCQSANDGHISALWSPAWMVWQQHRISIKHLWVATPTALWGIIYAIRAGVVFIKAEIDHVNSPAQHSRHHSPLHFQLTYFQPVFTWAGDKLSFDLKWTISLNTCIPNESSLPCPSLIFALCLSCY